MRPDATRPREHHAVCTKPSGAGGTRRGHPKPPPGKPTLFTVSHSLSPRPAASGGTTARARRAHGTAEDWTCPRARGTAATARSPGTCTPLAGQQADAPRGRRGWDRQVRLMNSDPKQLFSSVLPNLSDPSSIKRDMWDQAKGWSERCIFLRAANSFRLATAPRFVTVTCGLQRDTAHTDPPRAPLTTFLSTSSSTSKLDVSEGLLTSGMYGASRFRIVSQFRPWKNACFLKSSTPFWPSRRSRLQISLWMRSFASSDTSVTWEGN